MPTARTIVPRISAAGWLLCVGIAAAAEPASDRAEVMAKRVQPLLNQFCHRCHGGKDKEAGIDVAALAKQPELDKSREAWQKVAKNLRSRVMPPEGEPQPPSGEVDFVVAWLEKQLNDVDCGAARDPGRVTIRRLNRNEYDNTIRDLLGVDFHPAGDFPADDVGYGFDNIGDVLSMPPILLEKYLAAAQRITDVAIAVPDPLKTPRKLYAGKELKSQEGGLQNDGAFWMLASNGDVSREHRFPVTNDYLLRIRAWGDQAGDESVKMAVRFDKEPLAELEVKAVQDSPGTYETRVKATAGSHRISLAFINDYYKPDDPDPSNRDRNLAIESLEIQGPLNATDELLPESHKKLFVAKPTKPEEHREAAAKILSAFARRAYRRPVTADEVARLVRFVELAVNEGDRFEQGIQLAVQAALCSPHFLFRIERDKEPENPRAIHPVNDHELAVRLSYFLWSSMPDEELFSLAEKNSLHEPEVLEAQTRRMLKDAKSQALVENFAGQWLHLRNLKTVAPDPQRFPDFDDGLRAAMLQETELFFAAVMKDDRSVLEFLDSDYTYLNSRLARHYDIRGVRGSDFRRVQLEGDRRGGLLTQASVLTVTSNPTRTSPVKRGKWILEQFLGAPPPPPPPGVPELQDEKNAVLTGTLRQRMEQHRAKTSCAACHRPMDPLGFGLENFDAVGAWRTKDGDHDIDAAGVLPDGAAFNGPKELKAILKRRAPEFERCLSEKMLTYALGRGVEHYDRCAVDDIAAALAKDEHRFSRLIVEVVKSQPFLLRRGKGAEQ